MKVRELMRILSKYSPDAEVFVTDDPEKTNWPITKPVVDAIPDLDSNVHLHSSPTIEDVAAAFDIFGARDWLVKLDGQSFEAVLDQYCVDVEQLHGLMSEESICATKQFRAFFGSVKKES
jgi:hypothetical protein